MGTTKWDEGVKSSFTPTKKEEGGGWECQNKFNFSNAEGGGGTEVAWYFKLRTLEVLAMLRRGSRTCFHLLEKERAKKNYTLSRTPDHIISVQFFNLMAAVLIFFHLNGIIISYLDSSA